MEVVQHILLVQQKMILIMVLYFIHHVHGNRMYSVKGKMAYDRCLCPRCNYKHNKVVLKFDGGYDWSDK